MTHILTPEQLALPGTEHAHQVAFFASISAPQMWLNGVLHPTLWHVLPLIHAIPSGGARDVVTAGRLKAEGVRPGVPDVHLPVARRGYHSLYMEFKKPERQHDRTGGLSAAQIQFKVLLESEGNVVVVAYGWRHAIDVLVWYLSGN